MSTIADSTCPRCGDERIRKKKKCKPLGEWRCVKCSYASTKRRRDRNREKYLEEKKKYYKNHKQEYAIYCKEYVDRNKDAVKIRAVNYCLKNKELLKVKSKIYRTEKKHPDYTIWSHINQRCHNPSTKKWDNYGKLGIKVCPQWRGKGGFEQFIKDKGPRPEPRYLYSLDRWPDRKGNYSPENTRWATKKEQSNNTRSNIDYKNSIPDNSPIYYPFNNLITLKDFSEQTKLPLIVAKYRYAILWNADWILDSAVKDRYYFWKGYNYNMTELCLISGIRHSVLHSRIYTRKWSIEKAMITPVAF